MSLHQKIQLIDRKLQRDDRGWFLKVLNGKEDFLPLHTGEIYMTMAKPGEWRANHYHPETAEWFTVFSGEAKVILENPNTKERIILNLRGEDPKTLFVPAGVAHLFVNSSTDRELLLVVYSANLYDPADTVHYNLLD